MNANELGAIAALIGKDRAECPVEWLPGYDAKVAAMAEERQRQAEQMAEYNRLAALGYTEKEIQKVMGK